MRRLLIAIALAGAFAPAPAAAEPLPSGMIGLLFGGRGGLYSVGPQFGLGALWGVEAGWQPLAPNKALGYAVRWRTLFSGFGSAAGSSVSPMLRVVEMDLGLYARIAPDPKRPAFLDIGGGWSVLRSNVPLAPRDQRSYMGPYFGVGIELFVSDSASVTLEGRVGEIGGPITISGLLGVKFGV